MTFHGIIKNTLGFAGAAFAIAACATQVSDPGATGSTAAAVISPAPTYYHIQSEGNSTQCLDLLGGSTAPGTPVFLNTCNGSSSQSWAYTKVSSSPSGYTIAPLGAGSMCITSGGASVLSIATCATGNAAQTWSTMPAATNYFQIAQSELIGGSPGANVLQRTSAGTLTFTPYETGSTVSPSVQWNLECVPLATSYVCGGNECGTTTNGCGVAVSCGTCPSSDTCTPLVSDGPNMCVKTLTCKSPQIFCDGKCQLAKYCQ